MAEIDGASLHLIHVLDHPLAEHKNTLRDEYKSLEKSLTQDAERKLSSLLEAHSAVSLTEHLVTGKPNVAITAMVRDQDIDLLVMGSVARSGLPGLLVGNTAEKVFSSVDSSVLVLKP
jgi:universal stress protein E